MNPVQSAATNNLLASDAPPEVLERIFSYLDPKSLVRMSRVCTRWRAALNADFFWKYYFYQNFSMSSYLPIEESYRYRVLTHSHWLYNVSFQAVSQYPGQRLHFLEFLNDEEALFEVNGILKIWYMNQNQFIDLFSPPMKKYKVFDDAIVAQCGQRVGVFFRKTQRTEYYGQEFGYILNEQKEACIFDRHYLRTYDIQVPYLEMGHTPSCYAIDSEAHILLLGFLPGIIQWFCLKTKEFIDEYHLAEGLEIKSLSIAHGKAVIEVSTHSPQPGYAPTHIIVDLASKEMRLQLERVSRYIIEADTLFFESTKSRNPFESCSYYLSLTTLQVKPLSISLFQSATVSIRKIVGENESFHFLLDKKWSSYNTNENKKADIRGFPLCRNSGFFGDGILLKYQKRIELFSLSGNHLEFTEVVGSGHFEDKLLVILQSGKVVFVDAKHRISYEAYTMPRLVHAEVCQTYLYCLDEEGSIEIWQVQSNTLDTCVFKQEKFFPIDTSQDVFHLNVYFPSVSALLGIHADSDTDSENISFDKELDTLTLQEQLFRIQDVFACVYDNYFFLCVNKNFLAVNLALESREYYSTSVAYQITKCAQDDRHVAFLTHDEQILYSYDPLTHRVSDELEYVELKKIQDFTLNRNRFLEIEYRNNTWDVHDLQDNIEKELQEPSTTNEENAAAFTSTRNKEELSIEQRLLTQALERDHLKFFGSFRLGDYFILTFERADVHFSVFLHKIIHKESNTPSFEIETSRPEIPPLFCSHEALIWTDEKGIYGYNNNAKKHEILRYFHSNSEQFEIQGYHTFGDTLFILLNYSFYDSDGGSSDTSWYAIDTKTIEMSECRPGVYKDEHRCIVVSHQKKLYFLNGKFQNEDLVCYDKSVCAIAEECTIKGYDSDDYRTEFSLEVWNLETRTSKRWKEYGTAKGIFFHQSRIYIWVCVNTWVYDNTISKLIVIDKNLKRQKPDKLLTDQIGGSIERVVMIGNKFLLIGSGTLYLINADTFEIETLVENCYDFHIRRDHLFVETKEGIQLCKISFQAT